MYGFLRGLSTGVFLRGCAWMSVPDNNTENHEVVLRELSWLPGNKLARFSAAETLEPAPVNLENVTQKLHSMKHPVKLRVGAYPSGRFAKAGSNLFEEPVAFISELVGSFSSDARISR
jgi:hypothetical protein